MSIARVVSTLGSVLSAAAHPFGGPRPAPRYSMEERFAWWCKITFGQVPALEAPHLGPVPLPRDHHRRYGVTLDGEPEIPPTALARWHGYTTRRPPHWSDLPVRELLRLTEREDLDEPLAAALAYAGVQYAMLGRVTPDMPVGRCLFRRACLGASTMPDAGLTCARIVVAMPGLPQAWLMKLARRYGVRLGPAIIRHPAAPSIGDWWRWLETSPTLMFSDDVLLAADRFTFELARYPDAHAIPALRARVFEALLPEIWALDEDEPYLAQTTAALLRFAPAGTFRATFDRLLALRPGDTLLALDQVDEACRAQITVADLTPGLHHDAPRVRLAAFRALSFAQSTPETAPDPAPQPPMPQRGVRA